MNIFDEEFVKSIKSRQGEHVFVVSFLKGQKLCKGRDVVVWLRTMDNYWPGQLSGRASPLLCRGPGFSNSRSNQRERERESRERERERERLFILQNICDALECNLADY